MFGRLSLMDEEHSLPRLLHPSPGTESSTVHHYLSKQLWNGDTQIVKKQKEARRTSH